MQPISIAKVGLQTGYFLIKAGIYVKLQEPPKLLLDLMDLTEVFRVGDKLWKPISNSLVDLFQNYLNSIVIEMLKQESVELDHGEILLTSKGYLQNYLEANYFSTGKTCLWKWLSGKIVCFSIVVPFCLLPILMAGLCPKSIMEVIGLGNVIPD